MVLRCLLICFGNRNILLFLVRSIMFALRAAVRYLCMERPMNVTCL